jgi:hypothetical protein
MKFKIRHAEFIALVAAMIMSLTYGSFWGFVGFLIASWYRWKLVVKQDVSEGNGDDGQEAFWVH